MNRHLDHTLPLALGADVHNRAAKLGLYKECLFIAKALPDQQARASALTEVRDKWKENRGGGDQVLRLQIASCLDRIAYGRMTFTKTRLNTFPHASERYDWRVQNPGDNRTKYFSKRTDKEAPDSFKMGSGNRDFVPMTNWGYGNVDPDIAKRNKELTDRQHFIGPHWRNRPKPLLAEDLSFEEQLAAQFQPPPKLPHKIKKQY